MGLSATIEHNGTVYGAEQMVIERTFLGREDHGLFTLLLHVTFGGGMGTGLGQYALDGAPENSEAGSKRRPTAYGMAWIMKTIETVLGDYGQWENLVGKRIFALYELDVRRYNRAGFNCKGIASIDGERVFIFDELDSREVTEAAS